jgi:hypothetical protein
MGISRVGANIGRKLTLTPMLALHGTYMSQPSSPRSERSWLSLEEWCACSSDASEVGPLATHACSPCALAIKSASINRDRMRLPKVIQRRIARDPFNKVVGPNRGFPSGPALTASVPFSW